MKNISISILNVENIPLFLEKLKHAQNIIEEISKEEKFVITIHFDVMDNVFVPNTGIDIKKIAEVNKYNYYIDTHLMVEKPIEDNYIDMAIELGCKDITIHYEIENFDKALEYLLKKKNELDGDFRVGVSIKPSTDVSVLDEYLEKIDKVLVMSVEPGFGGQKYLDSATDKIVYLKNKNKNLFVQVDGGVNNDTLKYPLAVNVDSVVVGSYITKYEDEILDRLRILNQILAKEANN